MKLKWLLSILFIATAQGLDHSTFVPFDASQLDESSFLEQFLSGDLASSGWIKSESKKDDQHPYTGEWAIEPASEYVAFEEDYGLVLKTPSAHHAISRKLSHPFSNVGKDLVLQYEIKTQKGLECGGTYIKLLDEGFDPVSFNDRTPFQLMFGPDRCGANDKVHFIITKTNPKTGKIEEKHLAQPSTSRNTQLSALYTLVLKNNGEYSIRINGEVVSAGNVVESPDLFKPSLKPAKEIEDPDAVKPDDWDEEEFVEDTNAVKPDDYDEKYASLLIPDPEVAKPEDWLDDEPEFILDPFATKPSSWDDEEDGVWVPPTIENPKCDTASGCGEWSAPLVPNKNYKGPWVQPMIENPAYKGIWQPPKIPNPDYYEEQTPTDLGVIGGLGFELWSVEADVLFDNIYLGHSIKEAELLGNKTFLPKYKLEEEALDLDQPVVIHDPSPPPKSFEELFEDEETSSINQIFLFFALVFKRELLNMKDFWYDFNREPLDTIIEDPLKAIVYAAVFVFGFTSVFGLFSVLTYMVSTWTSSAREIISDAKERVDSEYAQAPEDIPKIVEIKDDGEEVEVVAESTGTEKKSEATRRNR